MEETEDGYLKGGFVVPDPPLDGPERKLMAPRSVRREWRDLDVKAFKADRSYDAHRGGKCAC